MIEEIKKIHLDDLPRGGQLIGKNRINWRESVGYKLKGVYDNIKFEFEITGYGRNKKGFVTVKYNDKEFDITAGNLSTCHLGNILGTKSNEFKFEIGQMFKDEKRDLIIIDKKYIKDKDGANRKNYKYHCNKCQFKGEKHYSSREEVFKEEYWMDERGFSGGYGCACCSNKVVVEGINDIPTTTPELVKYFKNPKEAKTYTRSSSRKITVICPDCGKEKKIVVSQLCNQGLGCQYCGDGKSYGEKFTRELVSQLNLNFIQEYSPDWKKLNNRRYDFYFNNNEDYIVEINGQQHYIQTGRGRARCLEEEQENDKEKQEIALVNGIKEENYIVIDCRKSELEWIKDSYLKSNLNNIFDLSDINWLKCHEFALKNLVKIACELKRDDVNLSTRDIANIMGIGQTTVVGYLRQGSLIWDWANYNPEEERKRNSIKSATKTSRQVYCIEKKEVYPSIKQCCEKFNSLYGININKGVMSQHCNNKVKHIKGYHFKFVSDLSIEQQLEIAI